MKTLSVPAMFCAGAMALGGWQSQLAAAESKTQPTAPPLHASASEQTAQIARVAQAFLDMLDQKQRAKVTFGFGDKEQRARWSNLPTSIVERRGLRMGDLAHDQRTAVMTLLSATLSKMGYEKIVGIMDADETLKKPSGGRGPAFGLDEFYVSFLGTPSATAPWMLQFGGHHLALNITFVGEADVITPSLIAVQPARYTLDGRTVRPLGRETDKAFELVNSLDGAQRKQAVLGFQMRDLVLGPGHDGENIQPEGIQTPALTERQRQLLLDLIAEWSGIIHDSAAAEKMSEIKANLADTWFAWSGPTEPGSAAYFRVQGPTVLIEYAPQKLGGEPTQHIHTMYRDPTNDYGKKLLGQ
jgi:Protein of unknown function (DUF3500)